MKTKSFGKCVLGLGILCTSLSFASSEKRGTQSVKVRSADEDNFSLQLTPKEELALFDSKTADALNQSWGKNRKPASEMQFDESNLSKGFVAFRNAFLSVKNAEQLEALLNTSVAQYDNYSDDVKLFVSQLQMLIPLRGVVWRMRPLFEQGGFFHGTKSSHSMAVSSIRFIESMMKIYLPTDQWNAGFEYLTSPSAKMTNAQQFQTVRAFQNYLLTEVRPELEKATNQVTAIWPKSANQIYVWDLKMAYGAGTFEDGIRRYQGMASPEVEVTLGAMHSSLNNLFVFAAYNQEKLMQVMEKVGQTIGINGFKPGAELGVTSEEEVNVLNSFGGDHFLMLRKSKTQNIGKLMMGQAFYHLQATVNFYDLAYKQLQKTSSSNTAMAINPIFFQEGWTKGIRDGLAKMEAMISGPAKVRSSVTGHEVTIDLPALFNNPPEQLLAFLPTGWDHQGPAEFNVKNEKGEPLTYRNYSRGRAIAWNNAAWAPYVTSAAGKDPHYMAEAAQTLFMATGGFLAFPVSFAVY